MRSLSFRSDAAERDAPVWRRSAILIAVGVIHVLLLLMLLRLAPAPDRSPVDVFRPLTVDLLPPKEATQALAKRPSKAERASGGASRPAPKKSPARQPAVVAPSAIPTPSAAWSDVIPLTREEFAAADVSKIPSHTGGGTGTQGNGAGNDEGSANEVGGGPNGERMYNPDWQRRPTHAELTPYLPADAPPEGWGLVACRTAEGNRVEDCVELGQSPAGSGLARAVRQAAWQFHVKPPRVGGRALIGVWVRIRIEYTQTRAEAN